MKRERLVIQRLAGTFAVCRLGSAEGVPAWALAADGFVCVTRTSEELSIVALEERVPADAIAERGFAAYAVKGPLDFSLVGVLAKLTGALAEDEVPVLAISTFDTDVLLIRHTHCRAAEEALGRVATVCDRG